MESLRALTRPWLPLLLGYALTSLTSGCSTMQTWWSKESSVPPMAAPTPPTTAIQPAGATSIATAAVAADTGTSGTAGPFRSWAAVSPVNKLWSRETNRPVAEIATAWRNKVEYLPNPAAQGALQPGLAGQVFLYTAEARPAVANGRLIVDLIDETPRPPGVPPLTPERWEFKKDVLKALRTIDERFGECYVIFLPWPTYRPDVTHVRLRVRYEPEGGGFPIYAPETRLILGSAGGTLSDAAAATPRPGAPESTGPGMGVFRLGGGPVNLEGGTPSTSSACPNTGKRTSLQVLEITPSARPSVNTTAASPAPAARETLPAAPAPGSTPSPHPTTPAVPALAAPPLSPSPAADQVSPLPIPPLVPGPLPQ